MIQNVVVKVQERSADHQGKNASRRLRRQGSVPGIIYGLGVPPFPVTVDSKRIEEVLRLESGRNTIFTLALAGQDKSRAVMLKEMQRDPLTERLVHVDFVRVDLEKRIRVSVPVRLIGLAEGVKTDGGLMEFVTRQVAVECLPADIPEHLDLDVSALRLNQHLEAKNLPIPERVELIEDPETIICVVALPKAEEAPVAEAAPEVAAAEPEVIKKGKEAAPEAPEAK